MVMSDRLHRGVDISVLFFHIASLPPALFFSHFYLYLFICLFLGRTSRHVELPRPGIEPVSPAVGVQSLNHRTTREVLHLPYLITASHGRAACLWGRVAGFSRLGTSAMMVRVLSLW